MQILLIKKTFFLRMFGNFCSVRITKLMKREEAMDIWWFIAKVNTKELSISSIQSVGLWHWPPGVSIVLSANFSLSIHQDQPASQHPLNWSVRSPSPRNCWIRPARAEPHWTSSPHPAPRPTQRPRPPRTGVPFWCHAVRLWGARWPRAAPCTLYLDLRALLLWADRPRKVPRCSGWSCRIRGGTASCSSPSPAGLVRGKVGEAVWPGGRLWRGPAWRRKWNSVSEISEISRSLRRSQSANDSGSQNCFKNTAFKGNSG